MVVGDGTIVRAALDALLGLLRNFAAPTGTRGSILLMSGGLIVLGFLFLAFLFRSAIVGDLAPVSNARVATPRSMLPSATASLVTVTPQIPAHAFDRGRDIGAKAPSTFDGAFDALRGHGVDARIMQSNGTWKRVRVYRCVSCLASQRGTREWSPIPQAEGCEFERGLLAGALEAVTGDLVKAHETSCVARGDPYCEFDLRHVPVAEVV